MSVIFIVAPVVIGAWPAVSALAAAAAGVLGYEAVERRSVTARVARRLGRSVDVSLDGTSVAELAETGEQVLELERGGLRLTFHQDRHGRAAVRVHGHGRTDAELERAGREFLEEVRRQYAYRKVVTELAERGFELVHEEASESGEIRMRVRRHA